MTTKPASLRRWRPRTWNPDGETFETFDTAAEAGDAPVLVDMDDVLENRDLVTLYRAAERNGLAKRLFRPKPALKGTPWYDGLERIASMSIECDCQVPNATLTLDCPRDPNWSRPGSRTENQASARSIAVIAVLHRGTRTRTLKLQTDFAVIDEYEPNPTAAGVLVTGDSKVEVDELAALIHNAVFYPGDDENDDSPETQWLDFMDNAHTAAAKLLLNEHEAAAESIRQAVRTHVVHLLPNDRIVQLRKKPVPGEEIADVNVVILRDDEAYGAK